jgi:glyoxylase-like metal-dependent hydrolase (beta-lactamase superfamily II)
MAEILPGVHQVDGVNPSPDFTTNVFLLKDPGEKWTLVDTALPGYDVAITKYLAAQKIAPSAVHRILITHLHRDHVGNLRKLAQLTKARTFAHWVEAGFIAEKPKYVGPGMPPAEPFEVDEQLKDGDTLDSFGGLEVFHTPGHTPGHTAYYQRDRKILFSGDLFMGETGGPLGLTVPDYTHHRGEAEISARRVAALPVESVMSYHGGPQLKGGGATLRSIVDGF